MNANLPSPSSPAGGRFEALVLSGFVISWKLREPAGLLARHPALPAAEAGSGGLARMMPQATHAHNELITLARAGVVVAATLVFYSLVLLVMSFRYAEATGGLSIALFLALALRFISEVPMLMFGYGADLLVALLIVITLASAADGARQKKTVPRPARAHNGVAS